MAIGAAAAQTVSNLRERPRVNQPDVTLPPSPYPGGPARLIADHAEAVAVANELAADFAQEAALRDREGYLPVDEIERFSQSGLWAITVPKAYGGPELSFVTVTEVLKIISAADPSLGQMPHNHFAFIEHLKSDAAEEQKRHFFGEVLKGVRFGNAMSEPGNRPVNDMQTRLTYVDGGCLVNGVKFYSTCALLSHVVVIVGKDDNGEHFFAFADRAAEGLTIVNDWSSFGQRTTASGTVIAKDVFVPSDRVVPTPFSKGLPTAHGAVNQILTGIVDLGIAKGALKETVEFVRSKSRAWVDNKGGASEDPFTVAAVGDLAIRLHAAEALMERAARLVDVGLADPTAETAAEASIATAEAKVLSTEVALAATNKMFELAGTRATLAAHGLDRHWRNARTHTLHDPVRWKFFHIGNYVLNDIRPPQGAFI
ncbi:SfnB family sulfur acquisition oxidoreductase [Hansschlegelia sp. KR7-227]|uniref:SfnB family sulfur acquisition oxidoreductase n=1 Tax=Hansschlegelia sp. KR7-227 TaxID=3400914 RepID=UPI003C0E02A7